MGQGVNAATYYVLEVYIHNKSAIFYYYTC